MDGYALDPGAVRMVLTQQLVWASQGRTVLSPLTGRSNSFRAWCHYPRNDAIDAKRKWQFYYHAHDAQDRDGKRHPDEHGHIHLFRRNVTGKLSHAVGLSLDPKGIPLTWFATNRWVTGEIWRSADTLIKDLNGLRMDVRGPLAGVARWLCSMVNAYEKPICEMLRSRDISLAQYCKKKGVARSQAWTDRSVSVWSTHAIDWFRDARELKTQIPADSIQGEQSEISI